MEAKGFDNPMWLRTPTATPAEQACLAVMRQGAIDTLQPAVLAVLSAASHSSPALFLTSWARKKSAELSRRNSTAEFHALGLSVSMAHRPASLWEVSPIDSEPSSAHRCPCIESEAPPQAELPSSGLTGGEAAGLRQVA